MASIFNRLVTDFLASLETHQPVPKDRIDNGPLLESTGLRVRHFNGPTLLGYPRGRDFTVAFKDHGATVEFATAIVHPKDKFCRKMGTKLAVESFLAGNTVCVPKVVDLHNPHKLASVHATLTSMFGF